MFFHTNLLNLENYLHFSGRGQHNMDYESKCLDVHLVLIHLIIEEYVLTSQVTHHGVFCGKMNHHPCNLRRITSNAKC